MRTFNHPYNKLFSSPFYCNGCDVIDLVGNPERRDPKLLNPKPSRDPGQMLLRQLAEQDAAGVMVKVSPDVVRSLGFSVIGPVSVPPK